MPSDTKFLDVLISVRWLNHFTFWTILTISTAYHGSLFGGTFVQNLANMASLLPIHILTAYLFVYLLIPRLLFQKKWLRFLVISIIIIYLSAVIGRLFIIYVAEPIIRGSVDTESLWQVISDPIYLLKVYIPSLLLPTILLFLIKMSKERFHQRNREAILIKEKQTSEINFLKAQMNPHLLFNTLNNIYSLALSKSDDTPDVILKLSDIMDYTLYECNEERVLVVKEWELIENYCDLEALRFSGPVNISLSQNIENETTVIAPLLLIPIVENAFKYGIGKSEGAPEIRIELEVKSGILNLKTFNLKNSKSRNRSTKRGIGIENLRRQLNLQYPLKHELDITEDDESYSVRLKIEL